MKRTFIPKLILGMSLALTMSYSAMAAESSTVYEMRLGNITSNDAQERIGQKFIDLVQQKTGGRIIGKQFSGGALGSNDEVMRGLRLGSVQAITNPTGYLNQFVPQAGVLTLPWVFPGDTPEEQIENITQIMEGEAGQHIREMADAKGFHVVSLFGLGPNQIYLRDIKQDVDILEQLKGRRIRTIGGHEHTETVNDWGARSVHMSLPEVYTSIQQGVLDGFDLPAAVTVKLKYHEQAPNVLMTNHIVLTEYIAVSKSWYDKLPDDLKKHVDDAGREIQAIGTQEFVQEQNDAIALLRNDAKINVIDLSKDDMAKLRELNKKGVWMTATQNPGKKEMLEMLERDIQSRIGK